MLTVSEWVEAREAEGIERAEAKAALACVWGLESSNLNSMARVDSRSSAKAMLRIANDQAERVRDVVSATLIARGRAHWRKFSDLYDEMLANKSNTEVAELARKMAAELNTYAIYRDAVGD